ncbi:MAG: Na(+)-translocating NADH-quinone reductase subunit F [Flavobacteriaceae bacterium]|nr:Na(+)-translocating NADH-quinone reductase subunit F [Flavobacteriaceae bacterium]
MKSASRLDQAIAKLYNAFNNNTLHPECSKNCAVGNILDNSDFWKHISDNHGSLQLNYVGLVNQKIGKRFNGYTPYELLQIEAVFLKACNYELPFHHQNKKPKNPTDKDVLFKGLSAVVSFLCQLDGIDNVMDYSKIFKLKNGTPFYELNEILI